MSEDNEENSVLVTSDTDEDPWYKYEHSTDLVQLCDKNTNDGTDLLTNSLAPIYTDGEKHDNSLSTQNTVISDCVDKDDPFVNNPHLDEYCKKRIQKLDSDRRKREIDIARFERWRKRTKYNKEHNIDNTKNDKQYLKYYVNQDKKK